jgi:hypothetical protein
MKIDLTEAFEALDRYGVRVARSEIVDSAEGAIAFAERRNAEDPRFLPILLIALPSDGEPSQTSGPLESEAAVRAAYERAVGTGTQQRRVLAQTVTASGSDIVIRGSTNATLGKTLAVDGGAHQVQRMVPLGSGGAQAMAQDFEGYGHHGSREQTRRMLEHLLLRLSTFFEESGASQFELRVRLHENGYTVTNAAVSAPSALAYTKRLDARAHDRWGDEYHPAGRQ